VDIPVFVENVWSCDDVAAINEIDDTCFIIVEVNKKIKIKR